MMPTDSKISISEFPESRFNDGNTVVIHAMRHSGKLMLSIQCLGINLWNSSQHGSLESSGAGGRHRRFY